MKNYRKINLIAFLFLLINFTYAGTFATTADSQAEAVANATVSKLNEYIVLTNSQTVEIKKIAIDYYKNREEAKKIIEDKEKIKALAEVYSKFVASYEGVLSEEQLKTLKLKLKKGKENKSTNSDN